MDSSIYNAVLEWEELDCGTIHMCDAFDLSGYQPYLNTAFSLEGLRDVVICRDENYRLKIEASGILLRSDYGEDGEALLQEGELIPGSTIEGQDANHHTIRIEDCMVYGQNNSIRLREDAESEFSAHIYASKMVKKYYWNRDEQGAAFLTEWYLNGPRGSVVMYADSTRRVRKERITRMRACEKQYRQVSAREESYSNDSVYIEYKDTGFCINKVPEELGPEWAACVSIEYGIGGRRIPDEAERRAIGELAGFLMGKNLGLVGYSMYDENNNPLETMMCNPPFSDVHKECALSEREIVPVHYYHDERNNFRNYMQQLLPEYIEVRECYHLDDALYLYWIANAMPIGISQPVLASGIETLKHGWYKAGNSKTKGTYVSKDEYEKKMREVLAEVERIWDGHPYAGRIYNRIAGCYQMGANEQLWLFFEEIGLECGELEKRAWKARNNNAHGQGSAGDVEKEIQNTKVMFLLLARTILKLLGYEGEYIDTAQIGFPRKRLEEAV